MTRLIGLLALTAALAGGLFPSNVWPETLIASHEDDADPVTEGFLLELAGPGTTSGPTNDAGIAVWTIDDASAVTSSALFYRAPLSAPDLATALNTGWRVSARLRAENPPGDGYTQFIGFATGSQVYQAHFRAELNGDLTVLLFQGFPPFAGPTVVVPGGALTYHTYELVSDGVSGTAALVVDGSSAFAGYGGAAFGSGVGARFGCGTSNAMGTIHLSSVELWIGAPVKLRASIGQPLIGIDISLAVGSLLRGVWHLGSGGSVVSVPANRRESLGLAQNVPNPFAGSTRVRFDLPARDHVSLRVFDVTGRAVRTVTDRVLEAGSHEFTVSMNGQPPGLYFYRLLSRNVSLTRKMLLLDGGDHHSK